VYIGATLAKLASWQVPLSQQVKDSDFGGSPTLFTATIGGTPTGMVGACNKNGTYYALQRGNLAAGPVWQMQVGAGASGGPQCDAAAIWDGTHLFIGGTRPRSAASPTTARSAWWTRRPGRRSGRTAWPAR